MLAFRNKYLQTMRFDEKIESEIMKKIFGCWSERGTGKGDEDDDNWLFFHHTHTLSMNVVDVYIRNRLNDV